MGINLADGRWDRVASYCRVTAPRYFDPNMLLSAQKDATDGPAARTGDNWSTATVRCSVNCRLDPGSVTYCWLSARRHSETCPCAQAPRPAESSRRQRPIVERTMG